MNKIEIKKNLEILGINSKNQLKENDIFFWWQKKYREIQKLNLRNKDEKLIELNNAREYLESVEISIIFSFLKSKEKKISSSRKSLENRASEQYQYSKNEKQTNKNRPTAAEKAKLFEKKNYKPSFKFELTKNQAIFIGILFIICLSITFATSAEYPDYNFYEMLEISPFLAFAQVIFGILTFLFGGILVNNFGNKFLK